MMEERFVVSCIGRQRFYLRMIYDAVFSLLYCFEPIMIQRMRNSGYEILKTLLRMYESRSSSLPEVLVLLSRVNILIAHHILLSKLSNSSMKPKNSLYRFLQ